MAQTRTDQASARGAESGIPAICQRQNPPAICAEYLRRYTQAIEEEGFPMTDWARVKREQIARSRSDAVIPQELKDEPRTPTPIVTGEVPESDYVVPEEEEAEDIALSEEEARQLACVGRTDILRSKAFLAGATIAGAAVGQFALAAKHPWLGAFFGLSAAFLLGTITERSCR